MATGEYCHDCGHPYPWTEATLDAARELADLELDAADAAIVKDNLDDIVRDTPRTKVAALKVKKASGKAAPTVFGMFRDIVVDVASETAKKALFGMEAAVGRRVREMATTMTLLRDPIWTFVGVAITIAIFATTWQRKRLSYAIVSCVPVVRRVQPTAKDNLSELDAIEIRYRNVVIQDAHLVVLRFRNAGTVEIRPEDTYKPITITLGGDLIQTGIVDAVPEKLKMVPCNGGPMGDGISVVSFAKFLLNRGCSITLSILVANFTGTDSIRLDADIAGMPEIQRADRTQLTRRQLAAVASCCILGVATLAMTGVLPTALQDIADLTAGIFIGPAVAIVRPFVTA